MKELFKGYYKLSKEDYKILWDDATFVFDTNTLLNLYRYQEDTRKQLLRLLNKLKKRIWEPHHVILEFQNRRLNVIADQINTFNKTKELVEQKSNDLEEELRRTLPKDRHNLIDPTEFLNSFNTIKDEFLDNLKKLEEKQIDVNDEDDPIRNEIEKIIKNNIGEPPKDQEEIDELYKDGEIRYKKLVPPGYKDNNKEKSKSSIYTYGGITYQKKFGDLLIWKQILNYCKDNEIKNIIFVTDDTKEDWWYKIESRGKKTIGVQPELIDEISREAGVERFQIYTPERFLKYANKYMASKISEKTINEVSDVSKIYKFKSKPVDQSVLLNASNIVLKWILNKFGKVNELFGASLSDKRLVKRYASNLYHVSDQTSSTNLIELIIETKSIDSIINLINTRIDGNYYHELLRKFDNIIIIITLFDIPYPNNIKNLFKMANYTDFDAKHIEINIGSIFILLNDELSNFEYRESFRVYLNT